MNSLYPEPDLAVLRQELARAGADDDAQVAGALWIDAAVRGIGVPKTTATESETLKRMQATLKRASMLASELPPLHQEWFAQDVVAPVQHALGAVTFALNQQAVRPPQRAHEALAAALRRFFEAESLPVTISLESPFVSVFAHCVGMDPEVAKTTLLRLRG